jgi:hypothetical protein
MSCLLSARKPLPHPGGNTGSKSFPGNATIEWCVYPEANETRKIYLKFVADGLLEQELSPWKKLVGQIVFGGSDFVADIQIRLSDAREIGEIPRAQRFPGRPTLGEFFQDLAPNRSSVPNKSCPQ